MAEELLQNTDLLIFNHHAVETECQKMWMSDEWCNELAETITLKRILPQVQVDEWLTLFKALGEDLDRVLWQARIKERQHL